MRSFSKHSHPQLSYERKALGEPSRYASPTLGSVSPPINLEGATCYRWSKDLSSFHGDGVEFEGTTVSFSQGTPADGIVTVTATITGTALDKLFVDIEVTQD